MPLTDAGSGSSCEYQLMSGSATTLTIPRRSCAEMVWATSAVLDGRLDAAFIQKWRDGRSEVQDSVVEEMGQ